MAVKTRHADMIIHISSRVLANQQWHPLLDTLASFLEEPFCRHSFDTLQYKEISSSSWLANLQGDRKTLPELIKGRAKAASHGIQSDAVTLHVDDTAPRSGETVAPTTLRIHPLGALIVLLQPFHLIVEDESSDGSFVLWMARLLGHDAIKNAYTAGRLLFRHAGGKGQIPKAAKSLTFGVWPRDHRPILSLKLRAAAMLDSDARFSHHYPNAEIATEVAQHVAFVHVLRRRYIESYIPAKYIRMRLADNNLGATAEAFLRMTDDQQSYFPIRAGFRDGGNPSLAQTLVHFQGDVNRPVEEKQLFGTIAPGDWTLLAPGLGSRVASVYQEPRYRCEPGDRHSLSKAQQTELDGFIRNLIKHL